MNFIRNNIKTIIISLGTGIFLFYIQPLLGLLGENFINFLLRISSSFSSMYYKELSTYNPYVFDSFNNYLIISAILLSGLFYINKSLQLKERKKFENTLILKDLLQSNITEEHSAILDKKEFKEELGKLEKNAVELIEGHNKQDNRIIRLGILLSIVFITLFANYSINKSIIKENIAFRNKMTVLTPIIGHEKVDIIKAKWCLMTSRDDFEEILNEINKYSE